MSLTIRPLQKEDSPHAFLKHINDLVEEDTFLLINQKQIIAGERRWVTDRLHGIKSKKELLFVAWDENTIAGTCWARKGVWKSIENVSIGIAITKEYRRKGLGKKLLRLTIKKTREILKPRNIYLSLLAKNKTAYRLYYLVGFRQFALFPKWVKHKGKYLYEVYMLLK